MIRFLALLLLAAPAPPPPATPRAPSFGQAVEICRAIESGQSDRARAMLAALPDDDSRGAVLLMCFGYHQALVDAHAAQAALIGGREI